MRIPKIDLPVGSGTFKILGKRGLVSSGNLSAFLSSLLESASSSLGTPASDG
jgi:hypothetical protein